MKSTYDVQNNAFQQVLVLLAQYDLSALGDTIDDIVKRIDTTSSGCRIVPDYDGFFAIIIVDNDSGTPHGYIAIVEKGDVFNDFTEQFAEDVGVELQPDWFGVTPSAANIWKAIDWCNSTSPWE